MYKHLLYPGVQSQLRPLNNDSLLKQKIILNVIKLNDNLNLNKLIIPKNDKML